MNHVLAIKTSIFGDHGQSSQLVDAFLDELRARHPHITVTLRDLGSDPVPHLDAETFAAFGTPDADRTDRQRDLVTRSDALIAELRAADAIVLGMPMYNFGAPSAFKAWVDHVARAGVSFEYTSEGPRGLLGVGRAWVLAARGGVYAGTPNDSQTPWLDTLLGFLGIADVEYVYAEGLARSASRESAIEQGQRDARATAAAAGGDA